MKNSLVLEEYSMEHELKKFIQKCDLAIKKLTR